jgi:hypothetical protein
VYIGYLRRKLAEAGARPLIQTVRGVGYVLREPAGAMAAGPAANGSGPAASRP